MVKTQLSHEPVDLTSQSHDLAHLVECFDLVGSVMSTDPVLFIVSLWLVENDVMPKELSDLQLSTLVDAVRKCIDDSVPILSNDAMALINAMKEAN